MLWNTTVHSRGEKEAPLFQGYLQQLTMGAWNKNSAVSELYKYTGMEP